MPKTKKVMNALLNQLLQSDTETEVLEFKVAKNQFDIDKLGRYFSALSNEANLKGKSCAWLLFGVNNKKDIVGTNISDDRINVYKAEIANNTSPALSFVEVHRVMFNSNIVLMFEIPAALKGMPIAWKGHYYGRDGESLGALNIEEIERIRNQANSYDWSAQIINEATVSDLSEEAIDKARIQFAIKNPKLESDISKWDVITFLNKAKLTIKGNITNTAILLLGKPESEHFLRPGVAKISWILRDRDNVARDYEHFSCPFLLNINKVYAKIRNLKYRYLLNGTLFPDEVDQYDPFIIREALNNCIAHQDYQLGGKINIIEREDSTLIFENSGSFIPQTIENVIFLDAPELKYRNAFLSNIMVNLNLIDTIGSGIYKMFIIQKKKYFPLPEYTITHNSVKVSISGKVLDSAYAEKLSTMPDLSLYKIILLDKIQKNKALSDAEIKELRNQKLIEGRKPNIHISSTVAKCINEKEEYIKLRGFKDEHYKKMILEYIEKFGVAEKLDIDRLLLDQLPKILSQKQKYNKIHNLVNSMSKKDKLIINTGTNRYPKWIKV